MQISWSHKQLVSIRTSISAISRGPTNVSCSKTAQMTCVSPWQVLNVFLRPTNLPCHCPLKWNIDNSLVFLSYMSSTYSKVMWSEGQYTSPPEKPHFVFWYLAGWNLSCTLYNCMEILTDNIWSQTNTIFLRLFVVYNEKWTF